MLKQNVGMKTVFKTLIIKLPSLLISLIKIYKISSARIVLYAITLKRFCHLLIYELSFNSITFVNGLQYNKVFVVFLKH